MKTLSGGLINILEEHPDRVVKCYTDGGLVKGLGFSAANRLENEARSLALYNNKDFLPLRVPHILSADRSSLSLSMEKILGDPIEDLAREDPSFFSTHIASDLASILRAIHSAGEPAGVDMLTMYSERTAAYISDCAPILLFAEVNVADVKKWTKSALQGLLRTDMKAVCIHSDFWLNNILLDTQAPDDAQFVVIDWEFCSVGSAYEDLGVFYCNVYEHFPDLRVFCRDFFNSYQKDLDEGLIRFFCVYRCLRLLSFVGLDVFRETPADYPHSFTELTEIIKRTISSFE